MKEKPTLLIPCDKCGKDVVRSIQARAVCFDCKQEQIKLKRTLGLVKKAKPKTVHDEQFCVICEAHLRYNSRRVMFCCRKCHPLVYKSMR